MGSRRGDLAGSGGAFFATVVALSPTAIIVVDAAGGVSFANEQAETLLNGPNVLGRHFAALFTSVDEDRATGYLAGLAQAPTSVGMFFTGELAPADGVAGRFVHVHGRNLSSSPGVAGLLLTLIDGTEARQRETDLARQALHDSLTGLANRTLLLERLHQVCDQGPATGALMMVDLDGFKQVNDSLGHPVGDRLLIEVAHRLDTAAPAGTTIARLGGDEFAVLLPATPLDVAAKLATNFCEDIAEPFPGIRYRVTASIGVSELAAAEPALRQADLAMYAAKVAGRDRAVVYTPEVERSGWKQPEDPRSVAALRAERDRLHTEARTDALTGVANRRALDEYIASHVGRPPVSVLFIDLDRFGAYNHRHGDLRGDRTLQRVAQTLTQSCRDTDRVFRKGGEEFVVTLPGTDAAAAYLAGERIRQAVEGLGLEHGGADGIPIVTVTVGSATQPDGDVERALHDAGLAAYAAKIDGRRNQVTAHER